MKPIHIIAIAAVLSGFAATAMVVDPTAQAGVASRTETGAETERTTYPATRATRTGEDFCQLCQMPVYVPPTRGSAARRIGRATRGSGIRG